MPCYQIRKTTVKLEAANLDLLEKGLGTLGNVIRSVTGHLKLTTDYGVTVNINKGVLEIDSYGVVADETIKKIKQAYAKEVVKAAAKKYGWHVTQDKHNTNKLTVGRRF